ncbi:MAG: redox-sensing transcriptional repressor Rex, partial [Acidimicrobiales bacterium]
LLGWFGTRGTGYETAYLAAQIDRVLGADGDWPVAIVGIGNLGRALAGSEGFSSHGFRVAWLFDADPAVVGRRVAGTRVDDVDQLPTVLGGARPAIGVISTPAGAAQQVADALVGSGVRSLLNFAPRLLAVPEGTVVRSVDLSIEMQVMSFHLSQQGDGAGVGAVTGADLRPPPSRP